MTAFDQGFGFVMGAFAALLIIFFILGLLFGR